MIEDDLRIVDMVSAFSAHLQPAPVAVRKQARRSRSTGAECAAATIERRSAFLDALVARGLMLADADEAKLIAALYPYVLRARALDQAMAEDGANTLGQILARHDTNRVRMGGENQDYDFYPQRRPVEWDLSSTGTIALAHDNEAGALKSRDAALNDDDPFKNILRTAGTLKKVKARQVRIDPLGRILDPGPR